MLITETKTLRCDMRADCARDVTHLDRDGYVYCTGHGEARRASKPCRKLRPAEISRLERGETLGRY